MEKSQNSNNDNYVTDILSQFAFKKTSKRELSTPQRSTSNNGQHLSNKESSLHTPDNSSGKRKKTNVAEEEDSKLKRVKKSGNKNKHSGDRDEKVQEESALKRNNSLTEKSSPIVKSKNNRKAKDLSDNQYNIMDVTDETDLYSLMDEKSLNDTIQSKKKEKVTKVRPGKKVTEPELGVEYDPEAFKMTEETLNLPEWAKEPNIRDKNGKYVGEEGYDPSTLYIPPNAITKTATLMKKYWEVKSQHYDKLVFIRLHKFYFVYHKDAYICHTECGTPIYNHSNYAIVYLYPHTINQYCQKLLEKNYKIVLVEPTHEYENKDDAKLEIFQILSKGTMTEPNMNNFTSRYCLLLTEKDLDCGFTYFDTTTHEFYMGEFKDSPNRTQLKSLLLKVSPVEIVYRDKTISKETLAMLRNLHWKPTITALPTSQPIGMEFVIYKINTYLEKESNTETNFVEKNSHLEVLKSIVEVAESFHKVGKKEHKDSTQDPKCTYYWTLQGVCLAVEYLEYLFLAKTVFKKCSFFLHELNKDSKQNLVLDGQTVYNLELLDVPYLVNQAGVTSLWKYIDYTKSPFGRRMLKKWLLEPLRDIDRINERLDAVEELKTNNELCELLQGKLSKMPDLERLTHSIYNFENRKIFHVIDFEVYVKPMIYVFVLALKQLREADNIMKSLSEYGTKVQSKRLKRLLNYSNEQLTKNNGLFPNMNAILNNLESLIVEKDDIPMPAPGKDEAFDKLMEEATEIKKEFKAVLDETKKRFKCGTITYAHIRQRYQLEIPEHLVTGNKKPPEFVQISKKKDFIRFHTPKIQDLIVKLEDVEHRMHKVIQPFTAKCFKEFYSHNLVWNQAILCLGELDCLASLAQLAKSMPLSCRPSFIKNTTGGKQVFNVQGMVHPCLAAKSPEFVRNNIVLEETQNVFLITGPNMGGKSTLMRSVCIATIMAQMGSYVACESFELSPRDRIFTRIGANDNIFEGKSTFFVELEETLNIVNNATEKSLVIIDELGRGTSTYDGMAIAYAVLKYLCESVGCLTFFATHFHLLLEEFKLYKSVLMYYMDSQFTSEEHLSFLYKFKQGSIDNSFGINVAKLAGLPLEVLHKGREIASLMTKEQSNLQNNSLISQRFIKSIKVLNKLEEKECEVSVVEVLNELFDQLKI